MVNPQRIRPTLYGPPDLEKLTRLRPVFQRGQEAVNELPPVKIIQDPEMGIGTLLYDGNHRLTLAFAAKLLVPAFIYTLGEIIEEGDKPVRVDETLLMLTNRNLVLARQNGISSFADLANYL